MTNLFSQAASNLLLKLNIDLDKSSLIILEDFNFNQFYINIERNIIVFAKYYSYEKTISTVFEFSFYRQGSGLVPISLKTKNEIASSEFHNNKIKIFDKANHDLLIALFDKYSSKYGDEFVITENILNTNNNHYVT